MILKYRLELLNWQQFEVLTFKVLQLEIAGAITFMEGGSDKGRDFLFSGKTNFFGDQQLDQHYIFQAKHKSGKSGISDLKEDLKRELTKVFVVNSFKYNYYCIVTNLSLSADHVDELTKVFNDFLTGNSLDFIPKFGILSYRHFESAIDRHSSLKWDFPIIVSQADFQLGLEQLLNRPAINSVAAWRKIFHAN